MEQKEDSCFEIIENLLIKSQADLEYWDLLITADRLIFVPLSRVNVPGVADGANGDPVKLVTRTLGFVDQKNEVLVAMQRARNVALQKRNRFFGLSIDARIRGRGALVIINKNIQEFKLYPGIENVSVIALIQTNGKRVVMEVADAETLCERLRLWQLGKPIYINGPRQGLDLNLPLPAEMLKWIEEPSSFPEINQDACIRAAKAANYCKELVLKLKKRSWPN